jgi:hypothetical protein
MLSQMLTLADSAGLGPRLWTRFPDAEVSRLVGADGVHEFPVAVVGLGEGAPAARPRGKAAAGSIDVAPVEFPLVTQAHHAGDCDRLGGPWPVSAPLDGPVPESAPLDEVLLRRGSTRLMVAGASVPQTTLAWSLAAALRVVADVRPDPQFVAVHAVDGFEPGLYRWPWLDRPLRSGNLRHLLYHVCYDQGLGGDASFVLLSAADLSEAGDRAYREAQLAAGIVEGRLHIAAFALGAGASGMTFLDSELPGLLGEPLAGLLVTCVGVPEYANRAGGPPGQPTEVRMVTPRLDDR